MQPGDAQEHEKQLKIEYSEEKETCSELQDHNPKEVEASGKTNHSIEHQDGKKKKKR